MAVITRAANMAASFCMHSLLVHDQWTSSILPRTTFSHTSRKGDNMKLGSTRMVLAVTGVSALCLMGVVFARGQAAQAQRPQMAEEVFTNLQVLRGIPVDEFMDTMGMFAASLSLNCIDCHVAESVDKWEKFADETPLKRTARTMVQMVNAINKQNFKGVRSVTCYTCHRGDLRPKVVPSLIVQYSAPVEDPDEIEIPPNAKGPSSDEIFAKYIQAVGGAQRVAGLTGFVAKGTYSGYETDLAKVPVEIYAKAAPVQRTVVVHALFGDSVRVFDGRSGWISSADKPMPLMPLAAGNLEGARIEATIGFPAQLKQALSQWRATTTSIDDRDVAVLQGTNPRQPPV